MAGTARRQRDLFENPPTTIGISIDTQKQMLELLVELLSEAIADSSSKAIDQGKEDGGDQNHS
jgi:hypothetical protein